MHQSIRQNIPLFWCKTKCGRMIKSRKCGKNIDSLTNDWFEAKKVRQRTRLEIRHMAQGLCRATKWMAYREKIQAYRVRVDLIKDNFN